jgi:hypothetical protein
MKIFLLDFAGLPATKVVLGMITPVMLFIFSLGKATGTDEAESLTPPPGSYRLLSDNAQIRFPFEIFRGDIRFLCEVNGHEVHMLLDDGFMWDQLLFWGGPEVDSLGLNYDGEICVGEDSDKANQIISKTASGITVILPGVEFVDQTAIVTPSSSGISSMWAGSAGQVSAMFFKHFVVDINFDDMLITLLPREDFVYSGEGIGVEWNPLRLGAWGIPATLSLPDGRKESLTLLMDLGYNDQLQLCIKGEHNIILPEKSLPTSLGINIQGIETRGFIGRLPGLHIGDYEINDLLVSYVSEEYSQHMFSEAMIGLGLLSRFNLVFDYDGRRLYVEPNERFNEPFEYNMSGLTLRRGKGEYLIIIRVHPDSPGAEAGLEEGDRVTHINGKQGHEIGFFELRSLLKQSGNAVNLKIQRNGEQFEVSLLLRRII